MLSPEQVSEIKEHLERAQNPLFYYDNDADGLCSFLILRRFLGRGKGVAVRSFPELNESYARKAKELDSDYVFVLDKPVMSKEFVEEINKLGLPIIWIDHHDLPSEKFEKDFDNLYIYNPARNEKKSEEPVTYLCYKITGKKDSLWLAVVGCIADHYLPEFAFEFGKEYPELWGDVKQPFDAYYKTEIGEVAKAMDFGLKDSITNVVKFQNFLISCQSPAEIFSDVPANYFFRKRYLDVKKKYDSLLEKARNSVDGKLIFFEYSGDLSISSNISNELSYRFPGKYIIVAYKKGAVSNISLRGKNVRKILEKVLKQIEGTGGGHEDAVGARIKSEDLERFRNLLKGEIGK